MRNNKLKKNAICLAVATALCSPTYAEEKKEEKDEEKFNVITVTSSRRVNSIQEIPINVFAFDNEQMESLQLSNSVEISNWVPGLTIVDQGQRDASPVIVRGLNTDSSGPASGTGGTVGTYVGEIPVYIDLKLNDIERVEVLIGPQGTLYGAGTLGGAIRYIPKKPEFDITEGNAYFGISQNEESSSLGHESGFVFNKPLSDTFAFRASYNIEETPGFIDYNYVVREAGVSNPQPDFGNPTEVASNLKSIKDSNGARINSGRVALRYSPSDTVDATLTYFYQQQESEGRSLVHYYPDVAQSTDFMSGQYESGYRFEEPNTRTDQLLSLEVSVDLGFAELVSATGLSKYKDLGQRDQTDLLLNFEYGYEGFPSFAAFTREETEQEIMTQEIRLVSTSDEPLNWIVGAFFNQVDSIKGESREYTPGIAEFWGVDRPDGLEYYSDAFGKLKEQAIFGEVGYQFTEEWQVTAGTRFYDYKNEQTSGFDLPLLNTANGDYGPNETNLSLTTNDVKDSGNLFKLNTSYDFSSDLMVYYTLSEGYRIGGINAVTECPDPLPPGVQNLCAQPDEILILPDRTTNNELGIHSSIFDSRFALNVALYSIAWEDVQVGDVTENGGLPITSNGGEAESKGIEVSLRGKLAENWRINSNFAYTDAKLTEDAAGLVGGEDAFAGDRLPGSPKETASIGLSYSPEVFDSLDLDINYNLVYIGDIITKVGNRNNGETLPSYTTHGISATLTGSNWDTTLYIANLTNTYATTAVRNDTSFLRDVNGFDLRRYGRFINTPRSIGVVFKYYF